MSNREPLTPAEELTACSYDPWGERDATYRTLSDHFVTTRKTSECAICFEPIPSGSRVRAKRECDNGRAATFRFCSTCCWLMAHRLDAPSDQDADDGVDNFERLLGRYEVGRVNAERAMASK